MYRHFRQRRVQFQLVSVRLKWTGSDAFPASAQTNLLHGEIETDIIYGSSGNDAIYGDSASDDGEGALYSGFQGPRYQILGGSGFDTIFAQAGDDYVNGEGDADFTFGGVGSDFLQGGADADTVYGGT